MSREMMVGYEHLTGLAPRSRNYDELMEVSGDAPMHAAAPQHPQHAQHPRHRRRHHEHHAREYAPPPYEPPPEYEYDGPPSNGHARHAESEPKRRRIVSEEPTHERQFPIGFELDGIAPGQEIDIEVKPQVYFRGERLAIPPSIARSFDIIDIKIGKNSQLAATGALAGECFSSLSVGTLMQLDTARPGIVITLRVRNVDTTVQHFRAVLYGAVLE